MLQSSCPRPACAHLRVACPIRGRGPPLRQGGVHPLLAGAPVARCWDLATYRRAHRVACTGRLAHCLGYDRQDQSRGTWRRTAPWRRERSGRRRFGREGSQVLREVLQASIVPSAGHGRNSVAQHPIQPTPAGKCAAMQSRQATKSAAGSGPQAQRRVPPRQPGVLQNARSLRTDSPGHQGLQCAV